MRSFAWSWRRGRLLVIVSAAASASQWLFTPSLGRAEATPRVRVPRCAGSKEKRPDVYESFLMKARSEGVDEALRYASSAMPKRLCLNFSELKRAAEFMTSIADDEVNETASGTVQGPEDDRAWQLQVCTKCLKKKTGFDTLGSLRDLQLAQGGDSNLIVEPAGCLKQCKHGPNVRAVSPDNELVGLAVTGMLPDEVEARCFRHVNDTAAAQRVFNSVRQAVMLKSGGSSSPDRDKGAQPKLDATMGPMGSSTKEKQRRGRVRKSLENRLTNILEGLPVRFSGEDLL